MESIFNKEKLKKYYVLIGIFILILVLTTLTPYLLDDYMYKFVYMDDKLVGNVFDIIVSQINHYFNWGGRTVAHSLAQFFLSINKTVFNICNAFVFTLLVYFINEFTNKKYQFTCIIAFLAFCFFNPVIGQTMIWLTGSCNYMWTGLFIIVALIPFHRLVNGDYNYGKAKIIAQCFISFLAGWGSENGSGALVLGMILILVYEKVFRKKDVSKEFYLYTLLALVGFLVLILAPGNYARIDYYGSEQISFLWKIYNRFELCLDMFKDYLLVLFIPTLGITLFNFSTNDNDINHLLPLFYAFLSLAANFAMILSPAYDLRSLFTPLMFIIISLCQSISNIDVNKKYAKAIINSVIGMMILVFSVQYAYALLDLSSTYYLHEKRNQYIIEQREEGNKAIEVFRIEHNSKFNGAYGIYDLSNPTLNKYYAMYYDVDEIVPGE